MRAVIESALRGRGGRARRQEDDVDGAAAPAGPVLVDHREVHSGLPERLAAGGLAVQAVDLPVGDYVLSPAIAIERKTGGDLTSSIKDGRLFDQALRLQDAFPRAVLIIEGEPLWMPEASWRGAVCRLVEDGVTVLRTEGMADSAEWILRLAKRARRAGAGSARALGRRRAAPTAEAQAAAMLACVPGISQTTARRLLEHFGSVHAVAGASEADLRAVEGVGPVRARAMLEVLHVPHALASGEEEVEAAPRGGGERATH